MKCKLKIDWLTSSEGGRSNLYSGNKYAVLDKYKHIDGISHEKWTIVINFDLPPVEQGNPSLGIGDFLMEAAPQEQMQPGKRFDIFEGPRLVGRVSVIEQCID